MDAPAGEAAIAGLIAGALRLDPAVYRLALDAPGGLALALWIFVLAGLSAALAQSVALFANRVRPWRFVASLTVGAGLYTLSVLVWIATLALVTTGLLDREVPAVALVRLVGLAHAPQLFAVLGFLPYFGAGIGAILTIWTYLGVAVAARATFALDLPETLVALAGAWLLTLLLQRTVGRPVARLTRWVRRTVAGTPPTPARGSGPGAP